MLEILALCSCACVACLWCASTLESDKKSKSHRKRHKRFNRSSSCPANRNSSYKKNPKSCQNVSCSLNTPFVCCKCNKRSRKQLRRDQNCDTARSASNFCKSYPIVCCCSDPGAQNTSRSRMHEVSNNEQTMNFSLNSPEDISYNISQDPIQPFFKSLAPTNGVVPEFVQRPVYSRLRSPRTNYYNSIKSWSPRYAKPSSNFSTAFTGAPSYKLICKTCQLDKHKCICANFWCNPIIRAGYPQFFGSNFSFSSDSPEFPTKGALPDRAPILLYPWSTVRLPPTSDLRGTNLKNKKSRKILSSACKRQKSGK
ncbi:uncharacterized protein LOC107263171 isoform X2 [Cephus cinctus]|uniref:Uncharacterized protein LOC107263171 isoform X2 n=1 Tax=Cephus cinctus TaxID=211228 RepID=A0AAJ7R8H6_CEPCN|nr:uncharacterized protein LOC107263171 isoform X2 [Cephus cinctus]